MKRTVYAYDMEFALCRGKGIKKPTSFAEDFVSTLSTINLYDEKVKTEKYEKDKKILYIDDISYDERKKILKIKFISARYGMVRNVMDTVTHVKRGTLKRKRDGDQEKTHLLIKFDEEKDNKAVCLYEFNRDGIGFSKLIDYLSKQIKHYHELKEDMHYYSMNYAPIVSRDFLASLEKLKNIKAVTITVDQEDVGVSETKRFAGRNDISEDIDIVLKPVKRGVGIKGNTVKEFYKMYKDRSMPIKRITVKGDRESKNPLVFNTEAMKEKYPIEVTEDINGEAISEDVFREMVSLCRYF